MMLCITTLVRTLGVMTLVGMASHSLPFPAQAGGVHVSIGVGQPVAVIPAPVIVQPAPVVVQPAPVVVQPHDCRQLARRASRLKHQRLRRRAVGQLPLQMLD